MAKYTALVKTDRTQWSIDGVDQECAEVIQRGWLMLRAGDSARAGTAGDPGTVVHYTFNEVTVEVTARRVAELERLAYAEQARQEAEYAGCDRTYRNYVSYWTRKGEA